MGVRSNILVGACIGSVIGMALTLLLQPLAREPRSPYSMRLGKDHVQVVVDGEYTMHHMDCVIYSIWVQRGEEWEEYTRDHECGHGLIPSNPFPPDGGSTDWEWEEFVNAEAPAHPNGG